MTCEKSMPLDSRDLDWSSEGAEKESLRLIVDLATKALCSSADEVIESYSELFARLPEIKNTLRAVLQDREWPADHLLSSSTLAGVILLDNQSRIWLLLREQCPNDWDCEAVPISLADRTLDQDGWTIVSRHPLLLRSMYGAVVGFRRVDATTQELLIVDGDSGWD